MINKIYFKNIRIFIFLTFLLTAKVFAQFDPHPELNWYTIETKNFTVSYHDGAERTARTIAKIAEEVYGPITSLYKYKPDEKVRFIVVDVSDAANGATDYYNNRIEILATPLDFDLRGTHNWLRNVITHEYTHMIQIQSCMKLTRKIPAVYLQWLNYEKERRPDVLYGYPNVIVSYPISGTGVPAWFAEGTAQYQRQQLGYDYWDANRDMILRSYILDDNMLSWNEMGQFSSITSLKAESIYNSGFNLVRYISKTYGEDKLVEISNNLGDLTNFSIDASIRKAIGKDGKDLYAEWKSYLKKDYAERLQGVKTSRVEGDIIEKTGFVNIFPHYSPDGNKIAYLSSQEYDFSGAGLYIYDIKTKEKELIDVAISSNFNWSQDGKKLLFAKRNMPQTIHGVSIFDIFEYDINKKESNKLTDKLRTFSPCYSSDGKKICFVVNHDGTLNLQIADANGKNRIPLTNFNNGEQVFNPCFSKDGKKIIVDYSFEEARKIISIDIESKNITSLIDEPGIDNRNPFLSIDGAKLYYSSNKTGIFNVYSYDLSTGAVKQITNVLGGAFMPNIGPNNNLIFASYHSTGYKISELKNFSEFTFDSLKNYYKAPKLVERYADNKENSAEPKNNFQWNDLKNFNDRSVPQIKKTEYNNLFTQLFFFPVLRFDNYTKDNNVLDAIKPGIYLYSTEVMSRFSIFGGFAMNRKLERDIFMQFEYRNGVPFFKDFFTKKLSFDPTFTFEGYNVSRKSNAQLIASIDTINVDVGYDLLEFDLSMAFKMININHDFKFMYSFSKYASDIDGFIIPQSGLFVSASSQDYFRAHDFSLSYHYENELRSRNSDINFIGRKVNVKYDYEISDINPEYIVNDNGQVITEFKKNKLHKLDADWTEAIGLFNRKHSLSLKLRGAAIIGPSVDDFYNFYASGLPGMKGYPFYALGGGKLATANLTYRLPLLTGIDTRISPLYLDKLFFSVYGDFGNAWDGNNVKLSDFKKDIGAELRLQAFSFYVFPTSIFFNASYGLDEFTKRFQGKDITYGKEMRLYFGVLFGFDI